MNINENIKTNLNNPKKLEMLYREDKKEFIKSIKILIAENPENLVLQFWDARLNLKSERNVFSDFKKDLITIMIFSAVSWIFYKIAFINVNEFDDINSLGKCFPFFVVFVHCFFIMLNNKINLKWLLPSFVILSISCIYIIYIPSYGPNSINNAYMHLSIIFFTVVGLSYVGNPVKKPLLALDYLLLIGEMIIWYTLLAIIGGILTVITIELFKLINLDISEFYFKNIVPLGMIGCVYVAFLINKYLKDVKLKMSSLLSNIFSPIVAITLIIFLISIFFQKKLPLNDRDLLIVFNMMLISVLSILIFIISQKKLDTESLKMMKYIHFILVALTITLNLIAVIAIIYRIYNFGLTPNRTVIIGINLLTFIHLVIIFVNYYKFLFINKGDSTKIEKYSTYYLPSYFVWSLIVVFILPFVFKYR